MEQFRGFSAFPVTPADAEGRVDADHLQQLVANLNRGDVSSIGVLGSTGSYMYLSASERVRALEAAIEAAERPVLAGIGAMRTSEVIANARAAEKAGAAGLLLAPVCYLPLTDDDVFGLFEDVAGATGLPIMIYNNPATTHFTVSDALTARLATIPGVAAIKNPPPPEGDFADQIKRLRTAAPAGFSIGYSGDSAILGAMRAGADAWYSVLGGTMPAQVSALWACRAETHELARAAEPLVPLLRAFDAYGSIRVVHEVTEMVGLGVTRPPLPLKPLDKTARAEIEKAVQSAMAVEDAA